MRQRNDGRRLSRRKQEIRRKRRKKRRRRRFLVLVTELFLLCVLGVVAFGMFKLDKLNTTSLDGLLDNGFIQDGYMNVALFGTSTKSIDSLQKVEYSVL